MLNTKGSPAVEPERLTVPEFADKNDITPKTVYEWIKEGKVIKKKLGSATFVTLA